MSAAWHLLTGIVTGLTAHPVVPLCGAFLITSLAIAAIVGEVKRK